MSDDECNSWIEFISFSRPGNAVILTLLVSTDSMNAELKQTIKYLKRHLEER